MGLDAWLDQDIRTFLDSEVQGTGVSATARLEDAELQYANRDFRRDIESLVKRGDLEGAKQLFMQLRLRYHDTPKAHIQERAGLYELLQTCYVIVANAVMDHHHTHELIVNMEDGSTDVFNHLVRPIDLSQGDRVAIAQAPEFQPFTKDALATGAGPFAQLDTVGKPRPGVPDPFSFEPEVLIKTSSELTTRLQQKTGTPLPAKPGTTTPPTHTAASGSAPRPVVAPVKPDVAVQHAAFTHRVADSLVSIAQLVASKDPAARDRLAAVRDEVHAYAVQYPAIALPLLGRVTSLAIGAKISLPPPVTAIDATATIVPVIHKLRAAGISRDGAAFRHTLEELEIVSSAHLMGEERALVLETVTALRAKLATT